MINDDLKKFIAETVSKKVSKEVAENNVAHKKEEEKLKAKIAQLEKKNKKLEQEKDKRAQIEKEKRKRQLERNEIDKKIRHEQTLKYKEERKIINKLTEKGLELYLKDNKHKAKDYKAGKLTINMNPYELTLIKLLKIKRGEHYTKRIFLLIKQDIEKCNEENKEK